MSSASFSVNRIGGLTGTLKRVKESSVEEAAKAAEDYARAHVQVLTGVTQDSIHTETEGDSVSILSGGASLFLEYGTIHMRAYPFLRPAMDAAEAVATSARLKELFEGAVVDSIAGA